MPEFQHRGRDRDLKTWIFISHFASASDSHKQLSRAVLVKQRTFQVPVTGTASESESAPGHGRPGRRNSQFQCSGGCNSPQRRRSVGRRRRFVQIWRAKSDVLSDAESFTSVTAQSSKLELGMRSGCPGCPWFAPDGQELLDSEGQHRGA